MKIRTRYTLLTAGLIGAVVIAIAAAVTRVQRSVLEAQSRERLEALTEGVARLAQESLDTRDQLMLISYLMYLEKDHPELAYAGVTRHGRTWRLGSEPAGLSYWGRVIKAKHPVKIAINAVSSGASGSPDITVSSTGVNVSIPGTSVVSVTEGEADAVELRLGFVTRMLDEEISRALRPLVRQTAIIAGCFMMFGWVGAWGLGQRLTSPLMALTAAVAEVESGNLDVEVHARAKDEVGTLAARFNEMTARIRLLLRAREDMLHTLSHELNTPLSGLKGYLELWHDRGLPEAGPARAEALVTMMAAVLRMENSLGSALRLFAPEAAVPDEKRVVWIDELIRQVCTLFAPISDSKRITVEAPPLTMAECLVADEELLRQVVTNLVSNALKYTPDGGRVRLELQGTAAELSFTVSDTGYGIKPEDIPHLFTKFYRSASGDEARARIPGTGLGLSIVEKAVKALGGSIKVESEVGKGSLFIVVLPRAPKPFGGGDKA